MVRKTVLLCDMAKPKDKKYTVQDEIGLYLLIKPTGSKV